MKRKEVLMEIQKLGGFQVRNLVNSIATMVINSENNKNKNVDGFLVKKTIKLLVTKMKIKFNKFARKYDRFYEKDSTWLDVDVIADMKMNRNLGAGRPFKKWAELRDRTKRLKVDNLAHNNPGECLSLAAIKAQKTVGCSSKVKSVKSENSQKSNEGCPIKMTTTEALSLKILCDLSDEQYQLIRNNSLTHNAYIYPTKNEILVEKKKCIPINIEFSEKQKLYYPTFVGSITTQISNLGSQTSCYPILLLF